jgi:hypothetical protein
VQKAVVGLPYSITSSARASRLGGKAERPGGRQIDHQLELGRSWP